MLHVVGRVHILRRTAANTTNAMDPRGHDPPVEDHGSKAHCKESRRTDWASKAAAPQTSTGASSTPIPPIPKTLTSRETTRYEQDYGGASTCTELAHRPCADPTKQCEEAGARSWGRVLSLPLCVHLLLPRAPLLPNNSHRRARNTRELRSQGLSR